MTRKPFLNDFCVAATAGTAISIGMGFDFPTTVLVTLTSGAAAALAWEVGRVAYELANRNAIWLSKLRRGQCPGCDEFATVEVTSEPGERRFCCQSCRRTYALRIDEKTGIRADYLGMGIPFDREG